MLHVVAADSVTLLDLIAEAVVDTSHDAPDRVGLRKRPAARVVGV